MSVDCDTLDAVGKEKKDCKGDFLYMDNEDDIKAERLGKDDSVSVFTITNTTEPATKNGSGQLFSQ